MNEKLEQLLEDAATEVARMKTRNDAADERELKLERAKVPSAQPFSPAYDPRTRSMDLSGEAEKAFLNFCRTGRESKALVEDPTGQYLVSPEVTAEIERRLPEIVIMRGLASIRTIGKDRIQLRGIGEASVGWGKLEVAGEIPESTMTPKVPVYKYVYDLYGLSKIGEDELADSDVNLANILADSFSMNVAEAEELAFVNGTGHDSQQPAGWKVDETLVAAAIRTGAKEKITLEELLECIYTLPSKFRRGASFLVHSLTALELRKLRARGGSEADGNEGAFLWRESPILGQPPTLLGYPVYTLDHLDTLAGTEGIIAAFGNFKLGYRILDHTGGMRIQRLSELYAEAGLVGFKIHKRVGGYVIQADQKPIVFLREKA